MVKSTRKSARTGPKKAPKRTTRKARKATDRARPADARIVNAALALAAEHGWQRLSLDAIAAKAGVTLAEFHRHFASKEAIMAAFTRDIDDQVLGAGPAEGTSVRDRLFEVLMRRFDALEPHRDAVRRIVRESPCDPAAAACRLCRLMDSMAWTLEAAGLSAAGPCGALRVKGLTVVYLAALRVWLGDGSADLGPTMAALDRALKRAGKLADVAVTRPVRKKAGGRAAATD